MAGKPTSNRANKASIHAVIGSTGSGKTTHVMACVKRGKPSRLLIWDKKGEFAAENYAVPVRSISDVYRIVKKAGARGAFKIAFKPRGDRAQQEKDFSWLCEIAFNAKNCWFIGEELSGVTRPGWSPFGWEQLTTQGRTEGCTVYGLSQSPALMDKTFFTNCTTVWTGRVNFANHAKAVAEAFAIPYTEIMNLEDGHYLHIQFSPREIKRGRVY
jgi:hypothetical protein